MKVFALRAMISFLYIIAHSHELGKIYLMGSLGG